jgi:hypothetical protein
MAVMYERLKFLYLMFENGLALKNIENKEHLLSLAAKEADRYLAAEMIQLGARVNSPQRVGAHTSQMVQFWIPFRKHVYRLLSIWH